MRSCKYFLGEECTHDCDLDDCACWKANRQRLREEAQVSDVALGVPPVAPLGEAGLRPGLETATEVRLREARGCPLTIIESPYGGDIPRNIVYLRAALRDSFERGETPFASHGFFPFFLRESDPEERKRGIELGYQFWPYASLIAFYTDYGVSPGMAAALSRCRSLGRAFELRTLKELP